MELTDKQEAFAVEIVMNGGNATEAYEKAYDASKMQKNTIWARACELKRTSKVSVRIKELRMGNFSKSILSIEERKEVLSELGLLGSEKAIDTLNKMDGVYDRQVDVNEKDTRDIVFNILPKVNDK